MGNQYFTIGMAGHIDHGKTSLTKALTGIDTDRLKEEKERNISIELGFAPLAIDDSMEVSIIDVPGHERFIRQMIAGVAGIDLVVLVVAADEGVMPQTKEHLDILSFLGINYGIVAVTKIDRVDEDFIELVEEDIKDQLKGTVFEDVPMVLVDSLSHTGIVELRKTIHHQLQKIKKRNSSGSFRLPIDQVFSVKGQGTVVRGTVYEGSVVEGTSLLILPRNLEVKARQIQVHHQQVLEARAGQRAAINLGGVAKSEIARGDVLVSSTSFAVSDTIDVCLRFVPDLQHVIKQRSLVKCHLGTAEVMGKIVFFDRNDLENEPNEVLCQVRLEEEIVLKRGDRLILRRPTPAETIAGGWVIDPQGEKYRFGAETIAMLTMKKEGTPSDRVREALKESLLLPFEHLLKVTSLDETTVRKIIKDNEFIEIKTNYFTLKNIINEIKQLMIDTVTAYHDEHPLRKGINKAELIQFLSNKYQKDLIDFAINDDLDKQKLKRDDQYLSLVGFQPTYPMKWRKRMENLVTALRKDSLQVQPWEEYLRENGLPEKEGNELEHYLVASKQVYQLDQKHYVFHTAIHAAVESLKKTYPSQFELKDAKDALGLSRKYLVPLLELMDQLNITRRVEDKRVWNNKE